MFPLPGEVDPELINNTLPAGSITTSDGKTYMMVVGTNTFGGLDPNGGSWMVEVTNDPTQGWKPVPGSYQPWTPNPEAGHANLPNQVSGYQGRDGMVYIAGDSFERSQGVSMYRVDPSHITDRDLWQPYNSVNGTWGQAGQPATTITPGQTWGELSFREVDGKSVLAGTNFYNGSPGAGTVEVHVGQSPTSVVSPHPTIVMSNDPRSPKFVPAPYGGYILPGSTLSNLGVFGSQWYGPTGAPVHYNVQDIQVNVLPKR